MSKHHVYYSCSIAVSTVFFCIQPVRLAQCSTSESWPPCYSDAHRFTSTQGGTQNGVTVLNVAVSRTGSFTTAQYNNIVAATKDACNAWNNTTNVCGAHSPYVLKWVDPS